MHLIGSVIRKKDNNERFIIIGLSQEWRGYDVKEKYYSYSVIDFEGKNCGSIKGDELHTDYVVIDNEYVDRVRVNITLSYDYLNAYSCIKHDNNFGVIYVSEIEFNGKGASTLCETKICRAFNKEKHISLPILVADAIFIYISNMEKNSEKLKEEYKRLVGELKPTEFPDEFKEYLIKIGEERMNNIYYNLLVDRVTCKNFETKNTIFENLFKQCEEKLFHDNDGNYIISKQAMNGFIDKYSIGETKLKGGKEKYLLISRDDAIKMLYRFATLGIVSFEDKGK